MARTRLFFTPEDHEHFLRIFPEARALPWTHVPERGCWQVEVDPDAPTPAEAAALGDNREFCLDRMRRLGHSEPPDLGDGDQDALPGGPAAVERRSRIPSVRPYLLFLLILAAVGGGTVLFFSRNPVVPTEEAGGIADPSAEPASERALPVPEPEPTVAAPPEEHVLEGDIIGLLDRCRRFLAEGDLTTGEAGNALDCYRRVLKRVPDNMEALAGIRRIEQHFIGRAERALNRGDTAAAREFLAALDRVNSDSPHLVRLREGLDRLEIRRAAPELSPEPASTPSRPAPASVPEDAAPPPSSRPADRVAFPDETPPEPAPSAGTPSLDTDALIRESLGTGFQPPEE